MARSGPSASVPASCPGRLISAPLISYSAVMRMRWSAMKMRWRLLRAGVVLTGVLGCGSSTAPTRPTAPPVAAPAGPAPAPIPPHAVEDARNLEAGRGVARDYLAAARLYL